MQPHDEKLTAISAQLKKGVIPQPESARTILAWFGFQKRGSRALRELRYGLGKHGIATIPDVEFAYIDAPVTFIQMATADGKPAEPGYTDPSYRLASLEASNRSPLRVAADTPLSLVVTQMLTNDYTQLPVMTGVREVKGMVSWRSIGSRLALGKSAQTAGECMEEAHVVNADISLFEAIQAVAANDCVLVLAPDRTVCGIVTSYDLGDQFRLLGEPFLLLGEIENGLRQILRGKFTAAELADAKAVGDDSRKIEGLADLTFGEYLRLIQDEKRWKKLGLAIDRAEFCKRLDAAREIRNDVMHFSPDGLEPSDLEQLREVAGFLKKLRALGVV